MDFTIEAELEEGGRWLKYRGCRASSLTVPRAMRQARAQVLALRVNAERLEFVEASPQ